MAYNFPKLYEIKLNYNDVYEKNYGSKKELANLYNNNTIVRNHLTNDMFFGEVFYYERYYINTINMSHSQCQDMSKMFRMANGTNVGFNIHAIRYSNSEDEIFITIEPIPPNGDLLVRFIDSHMTKHANVFNYFIPRIATLYKNKLKKQFWCL